MAAKNGEGEPGPAFPADPEDAPRLSVELLMSQLADGRDSVRSTIFVLQDDSSRSLRGTVLTVVDQLNAALAGASRRTASGATGHDFR